MLVSSFEAIGALREIETPEELGSQLRQRILVQI